MGLASGSRHTIKLPRHALGAQGKIWPKIFSVCPRHYRFSHAEG